MVTQIAIAVVERDGCYLIGLRPEGAPLAGLWEFPGGKVRPGEAPAAAARRECMEETGLEVIVGQALEPVRHFYAHGEVELHFFRCAPGDASARPLDRFRWVRAGELPNYEFPAANAELIAALAAAAGR